MAELTEQDVEILDGLLRFYHELVYRPEVENEHRKFLNYRAREGRKAYDKLSWLEKQAVNPNRLPEPVDLLDIEDKRKRFEKILGDSSIIAVRRLFERAGVDWDAALEKEQGRLAAFRKAITQWAAEEFQIVLVPPKQVKFDPAVADVLPSGKGYIGPRSGLEAAVRDAQVARALQTLDNIAGGFGGAAGYLIGGDEGSDIGAGAEGMLPGGGRRGGRAGRARRRNAGKKSTGAKGTSSRGTGSPGTGAKGTEASGVAPIPPRRTPARRRTRTAPAKQPDATSPPKKSSEDRAAARQSSAQAAAEGKKLTPTLEAKLASKGVDVKDPYTREKLNEIFTTNRSDDAPLTKARANSGELRALMREGGGSGVKRVRFLRPGQKAGDRTPDIEVTMNDGSKKFVEVRTVTGAMRDATVKDASSQRTAISPQFMDSVEAKLRHGQISQKNPGKILFHAPYQPINETARDGWRKMLGMIRKKGALPEGLERIEVTGAVDKDGTTKMLVFEPPHWKGKLFN
jgi:hypothetical protein